MEKVACIISTLMSPLLRRIPADLSSSAELIQKINSLGSKTLEDGAIMCRFDMVSLYTSVPPRHAVANLECFLQRNSDFSLPTLQTEDILYLLEVVLKIRNLYYIRPF